MRWKSWFWLALIGAVTVLTLLPAAPYAAIPNIDSASFMYIGREILTGQLPYRDMFENKPPMILYLNALGFALYHGSRWGIWALQVIFVFLAAVLAFFFLRKFYDEWIAGLTASTFLINLALVLERGNLTEEYTLLFIFAGLYLFSGLKDQKGFRWRSYLFGATFGLAVMTKQTMVGIWVAMAAFYLWEVFRQREWRRLYELLRWAGGAISVILPWVIYFTARSGLGDLWDNAFYFNFIYSATGRVDRLSAIAYELKFLSGTTAFFSIAFVTWFGCFFYLLFTYRPIRRVVTNPWLGHLRSEHSQLLMPVLIAVLDVPIELVMINISTSNFPHYYMAILPAFTILIATFLTLVASWMAISFKKVKPEIWVVPLLFLFMWNGAGTIYEQSQVLKDESITKVVDYVLEETKPEDYLLTWGVIVQVNFLANRRIPTRYLAMTPLFRPGYASPARFGILLDELKAHPPAMIIDTRLQDIPFVIWSNENGTCGYDSTKAPAGLDKVLDWVCQNYMLTETYTKDQWYIYRPRKP